MPRTARRRAWILRLAAGLAPPPSRLLRDRGYKSWKSPAGLPPDERARLAPRVLARVLAGSSTLSDRPRANQLRLQAVDRRQWPNPDARAPLAERLGVWFCPLHTRRLGIPNAGCLALPLGKNNAQREVGRLFSPRPISAPTGTERRFCPKGERIHRISLGMAQLHPLEQGFVLASIGDCCSRLHRACRFDTQLRRPASSVPFTQLSAATIACSALVNQPQSASAVPWENVFVRDGLCSAGPGILSSRWHIKQLHDHAIRNK